MSVAPMCTCAYLQRLCICGHNVQGRTRLRPSRRCTGSRGCRRTSWRTQATARSPIRPWRSRMLQPAPRLATTLRRPWRTASWGCWGCAWTREGAALPAQGDCTACPEVHIWPFPFPINSCTSHQSCRVLGFAPVYLHAQTAAAKDEHRYQTLPHHSSCCRLMEAAAWGCARWADSYLMPDDPASEGLQASFGAKGGGGPHIVAVLLQAAIALLSR